MGDMTIPTSSVQTSLHNPDLEDRLKIADELNSKLAPLYAQQAALSVPASATAIPQGEEAARGALMVKVEQTTHNWANDHNTLSTKEQAGADQINSAMRQFIYRPDFKLADVTRVVNQVMDHPNANTDYLGDDSSVVNAIKTQLNDAAAPLTVDANAAEAQRKSQLNGVNQQINDLRTEYQTILGTPPAQSPNVDSTTNNTYNDSTSHDVGLDNSKTLISRQFNLPDLAPFSPDQSSRKDSNDSHVANDDELLVNINLKVALLRNNLPGTVVIQAGVPN